MVRQSAAVSRLRLLNSFRGRTMPRLQLPTKRLANDRRLPTVAFAVGIAARPH